MVSYAAIIIDDPQAQRVQPNTFSWSTGGIQSPSGPDIDDDQVAGSDTRCQSTKVNREVTTQKNNNLTSTTALLCLQKYAWRALDKYKSAGKVSEPEAHGKIWGKATPCSCSLQVADTIPIFLETAQSRTVDCQKVV